MSDLTYSTHVAPVRTTSTADLMILENLPSELVVGIKLEVTFTDSVEHLVSVKFLSLSKANCNAL